MKNNKVVGYEEGEDQVEADSTIIAISQGPRNRLIRTTVGLEGSDKGLLIVDENEMTTRERRLRRRRCRTRLQNRRPCRRTGKESGRGDDRVYGKRKLTFTRERHIINNS